MSTLREGSVEHNVELEEDAADEFLPFALPLIEEDEIAEVVACLRSGWLTTGPRVREFEKAFGEAVGAQFALAVNSATAGLHLCVEAIGVGPGDRVITTPYTFTASAEVIRYLGADPVFVDIEPTTLNISPRAIERALQQSRDIRAILPVHFAGQAVDADSIRKLAAAYNCVVIDDAAHAFPATYKERMVGSLTDATVFSFYVTKTLVTGEGGMVTTDDPNLASRIRTMRLHGINRDVFDRYTSRKPSWYYEVVAPGYKYNMTDIAAAMGVHQLRKAYRFQETRERIARQYNEAFADLPVELPTVQRPEDMHAWHLYVLRLVLDRLKITRDQFIELMAAQGVGTSVHFIPLHRQPYWRDRYRLKDSDFPVATNEYERAVSLPIYPAMGDGQVARVIAAVRKILGANTL